MQKSVIIVAGGSGTRMQQSLPKQFIEILEKPIVVHTIEAFLAYDQSISVVLVLPTAHFNTWRAFAERFFPNTTIHLAAGGATRFQSVKSGLRVVNDGLVAIHDAVRPLISPQVIAESFFSAEQKGSGVVMVPLKDSIRRKVEGKTVAEDREAFFAVQTPQTFRVAQIKKAFEQAELETFTDDASVYEHAGMLVSPIIGEYTNLKITTPEDLLLAEAILNQRKK